MFSRRQFLYTLATTLLVVAAINGVLALVAHRTLPRRLMKRITESTSAEVVAVGNSLIVAGFDEKSFDAAAGIPPSNAAANIGLGASSPVEQMLLYRYAIANGMRPRVLVYGFFDFQLTDPVTMTNADLIGNRAILYYLEPEFGRRFYRLPTHDAVVFEAMRFFPMFVYRGAVWSKVEQFRRFLGQQGFPRQQTNEFGRASDFSLLEAKSAAKFTEQCNSSLSSALTSPVEELFREAHAAGVSIVVVEMPMSPYHRKTFYSSEAWPAYAAHARALVSQYDATFIDASDWIPDRTSFYDNLHLNPAGKGEFSRRLGELLQKDVSLQATEGGARFSSAAARKNAP